VEIGYVYLIREGSIMSLIYETVINEMQVKTNIDNKKNVVFIINFNIVGSDDGFSSYENLNYEIGYDKYSDFVSYENLTKEIVCSWITKSLGYELDNIKNKIKLNIEEMKNPTVKSIPLPW
jgi:hypothetical protein